uniref:Periviscerokinin-3 n=1 Tax=Ergaula capucina TaxID=76901 RepID=PVK3_ERGCA|nr:RecName: Full=Periviscerokinin-3; Short=ErgCa-PVK-3 [Ergaula capucina]
PQLGLPFPRV